MSGRDSSGTDIRDRLLSIFEQIRQSPGAQYEPERLIAFLTEPPAPKGRRVADTFAGRRRFVRFMNAAQLEAAVCFTRDEWERGFGLDDLAKLVTAKAARPDQSLRLAKQRLEQARRSQGAEPVKFGLLTLPLLVGAVAVDSLFAGIGLALLWAAIIAAVAAFSISEVRYSKALLARIERRQAS